MVRHVHHPRTSVRLNVGGLRWSGKPFLSPGPPSSAALTGRVQAYIPPGFYGQNFDLGENDDDQDRT